MGSPAATTSELLLASGDRVVVEGGVDEIEKRLSDASRSGPNRLAWLRSNDGEPVGINPAQVAALTPRS